MVLDQNVHRKYLLMILKDIYSDKFLAPVLGFKGGTAAYLFYGLDRFSVDLDFDLLEEDKGRDVFLKIEDIAKKYGEIKDKKEKEYTYLLVVSYLENLRNIKIEINKRSFGSKYEIKEYLGIPMLVMRKEDMFANKLVALTERKNIAPRDIYDIYFFLKNNWPINRQIVELRTGKKFFDYIKICIKKIENVPEKRILFGVGELIEDSKYREWLKKNLKKEVLFLLNLLIEQK